MNTYNHKYSSREELKQQIERDKGWYFITFVGNLPHNRPYGFTLHNKHFVLLKNKHEFRCYLLPLNENNADNVCVMAFPVVEKQGCIWFWHSKNSAADPMKIPTINECESQSGMKS
ncbi:hypothetical protein [Myxosarcina sp. GI1]|uniref:hypothetical protein n=1 Tax=Myxosarcina sp. GI1 TaxID=1541065 RepID=UPI00056476D9|nr:hypothetical protein [Myxosarcina sp. GI1]